TVAQLNAPVASHLGADGTCDSTVIRPDIVKERIRHISVAVVGAEEGPGEVGMIEHVEEVKAHFELMTFKRQPESLVQTQVHRVGSVSTQCIASHNIRPNRRIDDVSDVCRVYRVSVCIDVAGG